MNRKARILVVSAVALAFSPLAFADSGKTLAESQAEYISARDHGELPQGFVAKSANEILHGVNGGVVRSAQPVERDDQPLGFVAKTARELAPGNYAQTPSTASREQVRAELLAAEKAGELRTSFAARSERELFPAKAVPSEDLRQFAAEPVAQAH